MDIEEIEVKAITTCFLIFVGEAQDAMEERVCDGGI